MSATENKSENWLSNSWPNGIIVGPNNFDASRLIPTWRLRIVNRFTQRFFFAVTPGRGNQLALFLAKLRDELSASNLLLIDANLWTDGGKGKATPYHNDLWFALPLKSRVLQLWIPLHCEGQKADIADSMLRVDPNVLGEGWACGSGTNQYTQMWTGERKDLPFEHKNGVLEKDIERAVGGRDLNAGDVLYFDNSYCHYSLASKAYRVALAIRFSLGVPTYNGYFEQSRQLEGQTHAESNRLAMKAAFKGVKVGESIPTEKLIYRMKGTWYQLLFNCLNAVTFSSLPRTRLRPEYEAYASNIARSLIRECSESYQEMQ